MCVHTTKNCTTKIGTNSGTYKQAKYTIFLDWFEVTIKQITRSFLATKKKEPSEESSLIPGKIPGNSASPFLTFTENGEPSDVVILDKYIRLERRRSKCGKFPAGSKSYSAQYDVKLNGEDVAILHACSRFGRPELSQLKLANHLLYTGNWYCILEVILDALQAEINNVARIDIAIDGRGFLEQHLTNRDLVRAGDLTKVGKAKSNIQEDGNYRAEGFNVGTRKSGKMLTGYRKGETIQTAIYAGKNHKPYIIEAWAQSGLFRGSGFQDIERLELKLSAVALSQIKYFTVEKLRFPGYLANLFRVHCKNFYQWAEQGTDTNVTRMERIDPVEWSYFDAVEVEKVKAKPMRSALWSVRMTISYHMREYWTRFLIEEEWEDNPAAEDQLSYCQTLADYYGITDWFNRKLPTWQKEREYHTAILEAIEAANIRRAIEAPQMAAA
jgi:hypothetical protein